MEADREKKKAYGFWAACFLLGLFYVFFDSQRQVRDLKDRYQTVSLRLEQGLEAEEIFEREGSVTRSFGIPEEEIRQVTTWSQEKKVEIRETGLLRSAKAALLQVRGNMADVLPVGLLSGAYCPEGDLRGCVLDEDLAYALFRTKRALGNEIQIGKKRYIIRGIVESRFPVVMVQNMDKKAVFDKLEIRCDFPEKELSLEEGVFVADTPFYTELLRHVTQLPLWLFLLWIFWQLLQGAREKGEKRKKAIFLAAVAVLVVLMFAFIRAGLLVSPVFLPERYIPSRWSDFAFWERKAQALKQLKQEFLFLSPCPKDMLFWESLWQLLIQLALGIGAFTGFAVSVANIQKSAQKSGLKWTRKAYLQKKNC